MSSIPGPVVRGVSELLRNNGQEPGLLRFTPTGGGCINNGGRLQTGQGIFFLKWNSSRRYPGMFDAEAKGLTLLSEAQSVRIPRVVGTGVSDDYQFILMEFIAPATRSRTYPQTLGRQLAALHRKSSPQFGLDHANYIGSLPQDNTPGNEWISFFIERRLNAQLKLGVDAGRIGKEVVTQFDTLYQKLPGILSVESPSLIHGDLWGGNVIVDDSGNPCLIDPAVYYGHREVDLAMTELFGGFDHSFYDAYEEAYPTEPGLRERLDIYKLYPLLVHVNLFGGGYLNEVRSILHQFV
ncbi:MAG TPA: fructosamine kinase family protein [Cyclobacteriaceae bacterium]